MNKLWSFFVVIAERVYSYVRCHHNNLNEKPRCGQNKKVVNNNIDNIKNKSLENVTSYFSEWSLPINTFRKITGLSYCPVVFIWSLSRLYFGWNITFFIVILFAHLCWMSMTCIVKRLYYYEEEAITHRFFCSPQNENWCIST